MTPRTGFASVAAAALGVLAAAQPGLLAQDYLGDIEARVWFDRGVEPVLDRGDRVRVYYRTDRDAYVAIFRINTDGRALMVYPRSPRQDNYVRGNRDYRLLDRRSTHWYVRDQPGVGYYFIVASREPLDLSEFRYSSYDGEWNLDHVGSRVYADPYVAMDEFVEALIPDWEYATYALDFAEYRVGTDYHYPRFLCYDCHSYRPFNVWNPYLYACTSFRVVIWDSPYYYPGSRYRGDRLVYARRPDGRPPRYTFKERAEGEPDVPLVRRPGANPGESAPRRTGRNGLRRADGSPTDWVRRTGEGGDAGVTPIPGRSIRGDSPDVRRRAAPPVRTDITGRSGTSTVTGGGRSIRVRERPTLERRGSDPRARARPSTSGRVNRTGTRSTGSRGSVRPSTPSRSGASVRRPGGSSRGSGSVRRPSGASRSSGSVRPSRGSPRSSGSVRRSGGSPRSSGSARPSGRSGSRPAATSSRPSRSGSAPARSSRPRRPRSGGGGR